MIQFGSTAYAFSLAELRWQHRLIVVFAADGSEPYMDLSKWVTSNKCSLADRDVVVLNIRDNKAEDLTARNVSLDTDSIAALEQWRNYPNAAYEMLLIGKDGGVKASSIELDKLEEFIERIDRMPMRQQESKDDNC